MDFGLRSSTVGTVERTIVRTVALHVLIAGKKIVLPHIELARVALGIDGAVLVVAGADKLLTPDLVVTIVGRAYQDFALSSCFVPPSSLKCLILLKSNMI